MHFAKLIKENKFKALALALFFLLFFLTRIPRLSNDAINPDAVNWHYRSQQFVVGLKYFQFDKTYQHYHPGVLLMWITGLPVELVKQITNDHVYNHLNFEMFHFVSKFSLILVQLFLTILIFYGIRKIADFWTSFFSIVIMTFDPFFLGNSRLYHMDILFTLLLFLGLVLFYKTFKNEKKWDYFLAGVISGLTVLTRTLGIGLFLYCLGILIFLGFYNKDVKTYLNKALKVFMGWIVTVVALFPALWVKTSYVLDQLIWETERVGWRSGHDHIFFSQDTSNPGPLFYIFVFLIKLSPFVLIGLAFSVCRYMRSQYKSQIIKPKKLIELIQERFILFSGIFYAGYFLVMTLSSKKLDRYMLVLWPFLALVSYFGYEYIYRISIKLKKGKMYFYGSVLAIFLVFVGLPICRLFPYYFVYSSPLLGSPGNNNKIIAQKSFGVGIFDLKDLIIKKYGENIKVGMIDTKPLEAIYPNSQVFDIRVTGTNDYDILVLAVNETFTGDILNADQEFEKTDSIYINGLEYWRIYDKKK